MPSSRRLAIAAMAALVISSTHAAASAGRPPAAQPAGSDGRWVAAAQAPAQAGRRIAREHRARGKHRAERAARHEAPQPAWGAVSRETSLRPSGSYRKHYPRANARLVATINAKLRRWVHPTGRCGGAREWLATQYGKESGPRTASREAFRPSGVTAAHNSLPFGTWLRVWNPRTGASARVRVNDRGPATIADIDLSTGAAGAIGMRSSAYVCVALL